MILIITYPTGELATRASWPPTPRPHQTSLFNAMPQHNLSELTRKEAQIQLALQALKHDATLSQRRAAAIYKVTQSSLSNRRAGMPPQRDTVPNLRKLTQSEETVIVQHILNLNARGFPP
jgi:HEAT repeat protein